MGKAPVIMNAVVVGIKGAGELQICRRLLIFSYVDIAMSAFLQQASIMGRFDHPLCHGADGAGAVLQIQITNAFV